MVHVCARRFAGKLCQAGLFTVLLVMLVLNISLVIHSEKRLKELPHPRTGLDEDSAPDIVNPPRRIQQSLDLPKSIQVEVKSGSKMVQVSVDGGTVYEVNDQMPSNRGIHVLVLHQANGAIMASRQFDTYMADEAAAMVLFLNMISPGRVLIFTIMDEASMNLKKNAREFLSKYGSSKIKDVGWRDMWAMICHNTAGSMLHEAYSKNEEFGKWGDDVIAKAEVKLKPVTESECSWPTDPVGRRRAHFCNKVEGYGSVCDCKNPAPIQFNPPSLTGSNLDSIPVAIIAGNRPHYLFRMLRTLLQVRGVDPSHTVIFIDGYFEGPVEVAKLFGLKSVQHTPLGTKNGRICQHYKASLTGTFNMFPNAKYAIILEEDIDVAPDFFTYFTQTLPLLDRDPSLYCVSAWNDQGYEHSSHDPALLYRVETMPGLGWLLKRSLYKDELEPQWPSPDKHYDWDMWMRMPGIRKGRECIIPDISRTFHFGIKGLNMNPYFHEIYFKKKTINTIPDVKLKHLDNMTQDNYEVLMNDLITKASVLDHTMSPCNSTFMPDTVDKVYVLYIRMDHPSDYTTYKQIAKCLHIWDLDIRGFHKSMWRMFLKKNQFIIVGVPASPYAKHKPEGVTPLYIPPPTEPEKH